MESDLTAVHKQFPAVAEYLSSIYIILRDYGTVSNNRLAEWNEVSAPAVSQAIGRLKRLGLVRQKRYESVSLTDSGRDLAVKVLRRHYLIEHLLVRILDYPWDKADEEAKLLQTQISDDLTEHLYRRLGSPQTCPHGNPMPRAAIEQKLLSAPKLSEAESGSAVMILRITEEGEQLPSLLAFCHRNAIHPGNHFEVKEVSPESVLLRPRAARDQSTAAADVALPMLFARHIRYEPSPVGDKAH